MVSEKPLEHYTGGQRMLKTKITPLYERLSAMMTAR